MGEWAAQWCEAVCRADASASREGSGSAAVAPRAVGWLEMGVIGADFGKFPARSYAKPIFRCVVRVSVIVAPPGILLIALMANNRGHDQNNGCADDKNSDYQAFHFNFLRPLSADRLSHRALYPRCHVSGCDHGHTALYFWRDAGRPHG